MSKKKAIGLGLLLVPLGITGYFLFRPKRFKMAEIDFGILSQKVNRLSFDNQALVQKESSPEARKTYMKKALSKYFNTEQVNHILNPPKKQEVIKGSAKNIQSHSKDTTAQLLKSNFFL